MPRFASPVQLYRGTTAQNDAYTGAVGELTYDTQTQRIRTHDGQTSGGWELPLDSEVIHNTGAENISGQKTFTTSPIVPTPASGDSSQKIATTGFVTQAIQAIPGVSSVAFTAYLSSGIKVATLTLNGVDTDVYMPMPEEATLYYAGTGLLLSGNTFSVVSTAGTSALAWNTEVTLGTVGGLEIKAKLPANPNTDTHWTTKLIVGASDSTANAATTNGNTTLRLFDSSTARNTITIKGTGATTVTSDANGVITINSTDTNTVYTHPTTSGNKHIPSGGSSGQILRWSADGTAVWGNDNNTTYTFTNKAATLAWGTASTIATVGGTDITVTMPANPNTDTHWTTTLYAGAKDAKSNAATTNGNAYIKLFDASTLRSQLNIKGTGATTVTTDADGVITINSTDTNTTYTLSSLGIGNVKNYDQSKAIKTITRSGTTFTYTCLDGTTGTFTQQDNNTTYSNFVKSGTGAAAGLVPAPSTTAGTTKYLREDGTWSVPPDTNTTYTLSSLGIGNVKNYDQSKAIKAITRSGTTFTYTCLDNTTGTFTQQDSNTWTAMVGATASANGTAGYVPAPPTSGYNTKYLCADGTWQVPPNTNTWTAMVGATSSANGTAGYVPAPPSSGYNTKYLRADGTWTVPPDTNTNTWTAFKGATTSAAGTAGYVPAPAAGAANRYFRSDGTWQVPPDTNTNTTYTFATGSTNGTFNVTPSGGSAQAVAIKGLGTAAYTASTAYAAASHTHSYLPLSGGTLTGMLTINKGDTPAVGATSHALAVTYKAQSGTSYTTYPISYIGTDSTDGYNIPIRFGSLNGTTIISAGESGNTFASVLAKYNDENLYLVTDNIIQIYTNVSNDSSSYQGPIQIGSNTITAGTFKGALNGNASSATQFAANQSVALTGDVTGSASSKAGWSVATTLANSGVTAGSYGPSANATPAYGATFNVPYITVDAKGRITAASTKTVKIPASDNTNTTYTFATGDSNGQIKVTPSGGTAQNISVKGLGTAAYTASTAYAAASHSHSDYLTKTTNVSEMGRYIDMHYDNATMKYDYDVRLQASQGTAAGGGTLTITAANVAATKFTGPLTGNVTGNCSGSSGSCTGNAATATKLATARTIWGNSFDGSGNIAGDLTINNNDPYIHLQNTQKTKGTNTTGTEYGGVHFQDKNGANLAYFRGAVDKNGQTFAQMWVGDDTADSTDGATIEIRYTKGSGAYTVAPTPANNDRSTKIATTAYIGNCIIPKDTLMLFQQSAAPTGWTKITTASYNNTALRVVTGNIANYTDGSTFTAVFSSSKASAAASGSTGATTISTSTMPSHTHTITVNNGGSLIKAGSTFNAENGTTRDKTYYNCTAVTVSASAANNGSGSSHSHTLGSHTHTIALNVNYTDVIIAKKA